ncbi:MAG: type II toxin-antitoxin system RelE/ParE family toxin [Gammaproteobacteria bacterium]|nr:type II toxin-antitoxin system RelE/ParE family toxin [Gammaproteobacteria bacterium]
MAHVIYAKGALADLARLTDFLLEEEPAAALETVDLITEAVRVLANHPLIGRSAEQGLRELVISRGRSGYIALYSYELAHDTVLVLSVRHQREAGYLPE